MSTPQIGRLASLYVNGTKVGYLKGTTVKMTAKSVKDYQCAEKDGDKPAVLFSGNKEFKIDADLLYVDETYVQLFLDSPNDISIVFAPVGSTTNKPQETYNNCVMLSAEIDQKQDGIVGHKISFEASSVTINSSGLN
jgi:hypothetical protein